MQVTKSKQLSKFAKTVENYTIAKFLIKENKATLEGEKEEKIFLNMPYESEVGNNLKLVSFELVFYMRLPIYEVIPQIHKLDNNNEYVFEKYNKSLPPLHLPKTIHDLNADLRFFSRRVLLGRLPI